jgi:hypothetical protein
MAGTSICGSISRLTIVPKYGDIRDFLGAVRASGVENIAFLVDQREPQAVQ